VSDVQQVEATVGKNKSFVLLPQLFATGGNIGKCDLLGDWKHALSVKFVGEEATFLFKAPLDVLRI
jgi:hypothetical protein